MRASIAVIVISALVSGCAMQTKTSYYAERDEKLKNLNLRDTIVATAEPIKSCYETAVKKDPQLTGKIVVDFDISDNGKVTRTAVAREKSFWKNGNGAPVEACALAEFAKLEFEKPPANETIQVFFPLMFSPGEKKDKQ